MKKHLKTAMIAAAVLAVGAAGAFTVPKFTADKTIEQTVAKSGVTVHYKWNSDETPHFYYTSVNGKEVSMSYPGVPMNQEAEGWYSYTVADAKDLKFQVILDNTDFQTASISCEAGEYWFDEDRFVKNATQDYLEATGGLETAKEAKSMIAQTMRAMTVKKMENSKESITIHYTSDWNDVKLYAWNALPNDVDFSWPGETLEKDSDGYYSYTFNGVSKVNFLFGNGTEQSEEFTLDKSGEYTYKNGKWVAGGSDTPDPTDPVNTSGPNPTAPVPDPDPFTRTDFREETIYFLMTTRFYDGDKSNNRYCWDDEYYLRSETNKDPGWRGDFKGLSEKLDYIKALGFSAIWITPVVENASGLDYHGYHAYDFSRVDPRYESSDYTYQDLINDAHQKGIKIIQDIVLNHCGNWGERNIYHMFDKDVDDGSSDKSAFMSVAKDGEKAEELQKGVEMKGQGASDYDDIETNANIDQYKKPGAQYDSRLAAMKQDSIDKEYIFHHSEQMNYNSIACQLGQMAGDCVDLNTENPTVFNYLNDCYTNYINMGVDAFRIDTVKHISRLTFNKAFLPAFRKAGGENFYMFGECCARFNNVVNEGQKPLSVCFYTWKETQSQFDSWSDTDQKTNYDLALKHYDYYNGLGDFEQKSDNAFLKGNEYHKPDYSLSSGLNEIDFYMHWQFRSANEAFNAAREEDSYFNDSTWNVTYVDSHDYAPDHAPEDQRFAGDQSTWAENLSLMFTFRGIPCVYYGSEIEFQKGKDIDPMTNSNGGEGSGKPYNESGRAYFGDEIEGSVNTTDYGVYSGATGKMADTLNHPLAKHIQRLNLIRRAVPALQKGQYSTEGVEGGMAYKRRYTSGSTDSFVCVTISGDATFNGVPSGTYVDMVTGDKIQCSGTLTAKCSGKGNMRVYVLQTDGAPSGQIGESGTYLK